MTHMMMEDGLQMEIEAYRMELIREGEANPQGLAYIKRMVLDHNLGTGTNGMDHKEFLTRVVATLTLCLEDMP